MEKNIVVIDLYKYDELIKEIENKKNRVSELEKELREQIKENNNVNDAIYKKIYNDRKWDLNQILDDRKNNFDYHSKVIKEKFKEYGYDDENYINECIKCMIEDIKNENMIKDAEDLEKESEE